MRTLKLSLCFLIALLFMLTFPELTLSQTAVPMLINYQGELRSPVTGEPVPDGDYDVLFGIYGTLSGGTPLWTGTHSRANGNPVGVVGGIFSVVLGSGSGNPLDASVVSKADRWLEIRVEGETLTPRQRLTSAPYSIVSENSRLLAGKEASEYADSSHTHPYVNKSGDSMSGSSGAAVLSVTNQGTGFGIVGSHAAATGTAPGVRGVSNSTSPQAFAVVGEITSTSPGGSSAAVRGINRGTGGEGVGVWGSQDGSGIGVCGNSPGGTGVYGWASGEDGTGVLGRHFGTGTGPGVRGVSNSTSPQAFAVVGEITSTSPGGSSAAVRGINRGTGPSGIGVWGSQDGSGIGVYGTSLEGWGVYGSATGEEGAGVYGRHVGAGAGPGVHGVSSSTSANAAGVVGEITSTSPAGSSAAVRGINRGTGPSGIGVWGSHDGSGWGIYGTSAAGWGVYGSATGEEGAGVYGRHVGTGTGPGVHGVSTSTSPNAAAVVGEIPSMSPGDESAGVRGINRGTGVEGFGVWGSHDGWGRGVYGYSQRGNGVEGVSEGALAYAVRGRAMGDSTLAAGFEGSVGISEDLRVNGEKLFVHPHPTDPSKQIVYACLEGGENGVYVRGSGQLENGRAQIELPEHFGLVASENSLTAHVSPRDGKARAYLYVEGVLPSCIVVAEAGGGTSDARFDFLVMGLRRGFENHEVVQENDFVKPTPDVSQEEYEKRMGLERNGGMQRLLIENGTLTAEGKINQGTAERLGWKLGPKSAPARFKKVALSESHEAQSETE